MDYREKWLLYLQGPVYSFSCQASHSLASLETRLLIKPKKTKKGALNVHKILYIGGSVILRSQFYITLPHSYFLYEFRKQFSQRENSRKASLTSSLDLVCPKKEREKERGEERELER